MQPATPSNPERKARKQAQKALKAQQAADKKAAKPSSLSSSSSTSAAATRLSKSFAYILRHGAEKERLKIRSDGYVALDDVLDRPRVKSINMAEGEPANGKRRPGLEDVQKIVHSNDKKRFELQHDEAGQWWIRAVQGHSLKQVVQLQHIRLTLDNLHLLSLNAQRKHDDLLETIDAKLGQLDVQQDHPAAATVEVLHGTYTQALEQILASGGLKRMTRNHIHLAKGKFGQQGVISGMRKSANRLIYIDIKKAIDDGIKFVLSSNGVVLTPGEEATGLLGTKYFTRVEDQNGKVVWKP